MSQASQLLGFKPNIDTVPDPDYFNGVLSPYTPNPRPFPYFDVNLEETAEFNPFARIYGLSDITTFQSTPDDFPNKPRILKQPVRALRQLRFEIRLQGDRIPQFISDIGMDFVVEALSIAQVPKVPNWVQQRFSL